MIEENIIQAPPNDGLKKLAKWIDDTYYGGKKFNEVYTKISNDPRSYETSIKLIHEKVYADRDYNEFRESFEKQYGIKKKDTPEYIASPEKPSLLSQGFLPETTTLRGDQETGHQLNQEQSSDDVINQNVAPYQRFAQESINDFIDERAKQLQEAYDLQIEQEISTYRNSLDKQLKSSNVVPGTQEWVDLVNKYEKDIYNFAVKRSDELSKAYNDSLKFDVDKKAAEIGDTVGGFLERNAGRIIPEVKKEVKPNPHGFYNSLGRSMLNFFINAAPRTIYREALDSMPKNYDELVEKAKKTTLGAVGYGLLSKEDVLNTPIERLLIQLKSLGEPANDSYNIIKRAHDTGVRDPHIIWAFYNDEMNRIIKKARDKFERLNITKYDEREKELTGNIHKDFTDIKSFDEFKSWLGGGLGQAIASSIAFTTVPGIVFSMEKQGSLDEIRRVKAEEISKVTGKEISAGDVVKMQSDDENKADENLSNIIGAVSMGLEGIGFMFAAGKALKGFILKEFKNAVSENIIKQSAKYGLRGALKDIGTGGIAEFSTEYLQDIDNQVGGLIAKGMDINEALLNIDHKRAFNAGMHGLTGGLMFGGLTAIQRGKTSNQYAIQKRSTTEIPVEMAPTDSKEVVKGITKEPQKETVVEEKAITDEVSPLKEVNALRAETLRNWGADLVRFKETLSGQDKSDWDRLLELEFGRNANQEELNQLRAKFKPLEQNYFAKNYPSIQSISEAYHRAKVDGGNPELVSAVESVIKEAPWKKETKKIIPPSPGAQKIINDYVEEHRNPTIDGKELLIAEALSSGKVNKKSAVRFGDKNLITQTMAKSYLVGGNKGRSLDVIAQEINLSVGTEEHVTPSDIWDFMVKYPGGSGTIRTPKGNPKLRELSEQYENLTGKKLNIGFARKFKNNKNIIHPIEEEYYNEDGSFNEERFEQDFINDPEAMANKLGISKMEADYTLGQIYEQRQLREELLADQNYADAYWEALTEEQKQKLYDEQEEAFRRMVEEPDERTKTEGADKEDRKNPVKGSKGELEDIQDESVEQKKLNENEEEEERKTIKRSSETEKLDKQSQDTGERVTGRTDGSSGLPTGITTKEERPGLVYSTTQYSPPSVTVTTDTYNRAIDEHQAMGINMAIERFNKNGKGFILADGPGVGKTRQLIGMADQLSKKGKILIVTENDTIISDAFVKDAKAMGVDLSKFEIGTYRNLADGKIGNGEYYAAIFDEAHNLKNQDAKKTTAFERVKSKHQVFATATPMDKPGGAAYFISKVLNISEEEAYNMMGLKVEYKKNNKTGEVFKKIMLMKDMKPEMVINNVIRIRDQMMQNGSYLRREYPFYGNIIESKIPATPQLLAEQEQIEAYWDALIENAVESGNFKMVGNLTGQKILESGRWNEKFKISLAYDKLIKYLSGGNQVIIVAETVNEVTIKGLNDQKQQGTLSVFEEKLNQAGIPFAKIYGDKPKDSEVDKFQSGHVKVALMTPQSGGTGINLDDTKGTSPRKMIIITPNFSGDRFQQVLGRVSRRNTKSPATAELIYTDSYTDNHRKKTVDKKLAVLNAIQHGKITEEDFDIEGVDTTKPSQLTIIEVNPTTIAIVGDTYPIKDKIKEIAINNNVTATWNAKNKYWMLPKSVENQAKLLVAEANGKNPQAQFTNQHVDGRTIKQRQAASKILAPKAAQKLINWLSNKVKGIRPVVFDYDKLVAAWDDFKRNGGIIFLQSTEQEIPITSYTLSALEKIPQFKQMEGKTVKPITIRQLLNKPGIKQIEKDIINDVIETNFKGQDKFNYNDFKAAVNSRILKLDKIYSKSFSGYGMERIALNADTSWTVILNAPVQHGEKGHFTKDFVLENVKWDVKEVTQPNGTKVFVAIEEDTPPGLSPEALLPFIGTAGTENEVRQWIKMYYENVAKNTERNVGLFGHFRAWLKDKNFFIPEVQSDFYQKHRAMEALSVKGELSLLEKQFVAYEKSHMIRIVDEAIKEAALRGSEYAYFPLPHTLAVIEGYIGSHVPYETSTPGNLNEGDTIIYLDMTYIVIESTSTRIKVSPIVKTRIIDLADYIDDEVNFRMEEFLYELRKKVSDPTAMTKADIEALEDIVPDRIREEMLDEAELGPTDIDDFIDKIRDHINEYVNSYVDAGYLMDIHGGDTYNQVDDTVYIGSDVEELLQPDQYDLYESKSEFYDQLEDKAFDNVEQTVLEKYKELNDDILKNYEGSEKYSDAQGYDWIKIPLNKTRYASLVAFRQQQNNQRIPNGFIYKDQVYINPKATRMDTPIHEFGHLWVNVLKHSKDKALYRLGIELVKNTTYEADVRNNPAYAGLTDAEVYDEALAIAIGEKGAELWDRPTWRKWWDNFVAKIKQILGLKEEIDFNTLTMAEWANIAAKELMTPGQVISLSSIHSPETAIFTLKNYKMPQDAFKAFQTRLESDAAISLAPQQWNALKRDGERFYGENLLAYWFRTKPVLRQVSDIKEIILDYFADRERILKLIQNNIVDQYYTLVVNGIKADPNLTQKEKTAKIKSINKAALRERIISDSKDIYGLMEVLPGKQHRAIQVVREKLFGINPAEDEAGSIIEWLTKNTSVTGKVKLTEGTIAYNLAKEGLTFLDFGMYAYASMAKYRNAKHRADSNGKIQAGSGMPDDVADDFLRYFDETGKTRVLEETFRQIRQMQEGMLKMELDAGLITKELYDHLITYDGGRWMPLYVTEYHKNTNVYNNSHIKGVWSNGIKKAKGSDEHTFDQRTNPFVGWLTNYEERLKRLEHHKVLNALADLVKSTTEPIIDGGQKKANPNKKYWRIEKTKIKPGPQEIDDNGNLKPLQFQDLTDKEAKKIGIPYVDKKTGRLAYIVFRDPRLIKLFTTAQRNQAGETFIKSLSSVMNFLRVMRLNLSADWGATNFFRDLQDSIINIGDEKNIRRRIVEVIPEVIKNVWAFEAGKRDISDKLIAQVNADPGLTNEQKAKRIAEIRQEYQIIKIIEEQRANGGYISSINYNDADKVFKQVEKLINDYERSQKSNPITGLLTYAPKQIFRQIFIYGKVMENAIRTATYMILREQGVSELKAAKAALNVTVNLLKRGYLSPYFSAAFLFFNASVQGPLRAIRSLYTSSKARKFIIGGMASSMVVHVMNELFAGMDDDDEKRKAYYKAISIQDHKKNLYLYNPIPEVKMAIGMSGKPGLSYFKIPVSYNLQPFKSLADNLYFTLSGEIDVGEASINIMDAFVSWGNPFYEHTEKGMFVPTVIEPYAEIKSNKKFFFDTPIYPEDVFNPGKPDSEKYYKHTPKIYIEASDFLSEMQPNRTDDFLEVSPNSLEHVTHWIMGGFKSYIETGSSVVDIARGGQEGIDPNRFPLLRRLYADLDRQQYRFIQRQKYLVDRGMSKKITQKEFDELASETAIYVMEGHIRLDYYIKGIKDVWLYQMDYFGNKLDLPMGSIKEVVSDDNAVMEYINNQYDLFKNKKLPKIKNRITVLEGLQ